MKKSFSVLAAALAAGTIFTSSVSPASADFVDSNGTIYEEAVNFLVDNYIAMGYQTHLGVEQPIKRVDAAVLLAKYLELDGHTAPKTNFKDVPARATQAVAILKHHGIVYGKSDVYFGATDIITRGEAAVIFYRAFGTETLEGTSENSTSTKFTDVTGRYVEAVNFLVERGVIQGKSNNRFGTTEPLTRGQFALMIHRMHLYYDKKPMEFLNS
ncbi:S-layer homology domain-containing protein [Domibacillus sp. A3M-37]|uniref:S-layer homology domain-containing protein n=1 Tax=Domibacillus sp. A3M-37 TaxID=2962037 RepID=UPI0020B8812A|nr:S-layer homology domain-containing protein [Domibacillus sp. A3M-37]MCP3764574.1 S-layer homology domain-containing protein [Domibacillus sp. A3M-37]